MKARQKLTHKQITAARNEFDKFHEDVFRECADDIMVQCMITMFWTLATNFEFGKKRLHKLIDALHDTEQLMNNPSPLHHKFSALDLDNVLKDKYGIDIAREFKATIEVKR